jgi:hypothetical protein
MPGEQEEGIFELLGDLVTDGIRRIFQNDEKKDEDDEDDEEEDYAEESYEAQQAESGDSNKVGHADSRTVAEEGDAQRALETGNEIKERMLVQSCLNSQVNTHNGRENGTDNIFL